MRTSRLKTKYARQRWAAVLCLAAFLMLTFSESWHTCQDDCCKFIGLNHLVLTTNLHHHHCVACEMVFSNTGCTTFTSTFNYIFFSNVCAADTPCTLAIVSVDLIGTSSRSPPLS